MPNPRIAIMIAGIAKPGMEDYIKHFLTDLMHASQQDGGCLVYQVHQSSENPAEFMMYSQWENLAAFEQHNESPMMKEFKKELAKELFTQTSPKTFWEILD